MPQTPSSPTFPTATAPAEHIPDERKPGRSFEDPSKPLGQEALEQSGTSDLSAREDFRSREAQADMPHNGVSERAKAVSVMRKTEELIATHNPGANDEASLQRCFELGAGRVGLTIEEYDALVKGDPELEKLEAQVREAARANFGKQPPPNLPTS
ncbi:MAG: hypothetical protein JWP97_1636 [Labilithrix sp.]|nr:hypothetical protein [Labilithrix sp.]